MAESEGKTLSQEFDDIYTEFKGIVDGVDATSSVVSQVNIKLLLCNLLGIRNLADFCLVSSFAELDSADDKGAGGVDVGCVRSGHVQ